MSPDCVYGIQWACVRIPDSRSIVGVQGLRLHPEELSLAARDYPAVYDALDDNQIIIYNQDKSFGKHRWKSQSQILHTSVSLSSKSRVSSQRDNNADVLAEVLWDWDSQLKLKTMRRDTKPPNPEADRLLCGRPHLRRTSMKPVEGPACSCEQKAAAVSRPPYPRSPTTRQISCA